MKNLIFYCLFLLLFSCNNSGTSESQYQEEKASLEEQEKQNPKRFLTTEGTYRPTVFGSREVLEGTISNGATVATYKDIVLEVFCNDEAGNELGRQTVTIFETITPNHTHSFKTKVDVPEGTNSVGWEIQGAKAVE